MISTVGDAITRALSNAPLRPHHPHRDKKDPKLKSSKTPTSTSTKKKKDGSKHNPDNAGHVAVPKTVVPPSPLPLDLSEVNFVCSHPKPLLPAQDDKSEQWNRGHLAQTWAPLGGWEEGKVAGPTTGSKYEEGGELEALDLGEKEAYLGEVLPAKILGAFLVSWGKDGVHQDGKKYVIVAVRKDDTLASVADSLEELTAARPEILRAVETFLQSCGHYDLSSHRPTRECHVAVNQLPAARAKSIIRAAHFSWLFARPSPKGGQSSRATSAARSFVASSSSSRASSARSVGPLCTLEMESSSKNETKPRYCSMPKGAMRSTDGIIGGWRRTTLPSAIGTALSLETEDDKRESPPFQENLQPLTIVGLSDVIENDDSLEDSWLSTSTPTRSQTPLTVPSEKGFSPEDSLWAGSKIKLLDRTSSPADPLLTSTVRTIQGAGKSAPPAHRHRQWSESPPTSSIGIGRSALPSSQSMGRHADREPVQGDLVKRSLNLCITPNLPRHLVQWHAAMAGSPTHSGSPQVDDTGGQPGTVAAEHSRGVSVQAGRGHRRTQSTDCAVRLGRACHVDGSGSLYSGSCQEAAWKQGAHRARLAGGLELDPGLFIGPEDVSESDCAVDDSWQTSHEMEASSTGCALGALVTPRWRAEDLTQQEAYHGEGHVAERSVYALVTPRYARPAGNGWKVGEGGGPTRGHRRMGSVPTLPAGIVARGGSCEQWGADYLPRSASVRLGRASEVSRIILSSPKTQNLQFKARSKSSEKKTGLSQEGERGTSTTAAQEFERLREERGIFRSNSLTGPAAGGMPASFVLSNRQQEQGDILNSPRTPAGGDLLFGSGGREVGHRRAQSISPFDTWQMNSNSPASGAPKPLPALRHCHSPLEAWQLGKWCKEGGGGGEDVPPSASGGDSLATGDIVQQRTLGPPAQVTQKRVYRRSASLTERSATGAWLSTSSLAHECADGPNPSKVTSRVQISAVELSVPQPGSAIAPHNQFTESRWCSPRVSRPGASAGNSRANSTTQSRLSPLALSYGEWGEGRGGPSVLGEGNGGASWHAGSTVSSLIFGTRAAGSPADSSPEPSSVIRSLSQRKQGQVSNKERGRHMARSYSSWRETGRGGAFVDDLKDEGPEKKQLFQVVDTYFVPLKREDCTSSAVEASWKAGRSPGSRQDSGCNRIPSDTEVSRRTRGSRTRVQKDCKGDEEGLLSFPGMRNEVRELERSDSEGEGETKKN